MFLQALFAECVIAPQLHNLAELNKFFHANHAFLLILGYVSMREVIKWLVL